VSLSSSDESLIVRLQSLPAAERALELEKACEKDPSLRGRRAEIWSILEFADDPAITLSSAPPSADTMVDALEAALKAAPTERPGARIGPYKLLQEIGRGGFGAVWMAEQEEPIRRRVALKIIKAGMDTKEVVARFEAERQALALMDHPNIARVFAAGATDGGRPYFVMELVRGTSITRYCDENRLTVEARLRLFIRVCLAVQHAHQKGVIHRDLKPSNILVTLDEGMPVPKVIDFGIAKATMTRLTEKTLFTQFHAFIGTPSYTSPEQMEMSGLDVDTRSDVYSLGVLLYELLAGRPPFDAEKLLKSGLEAMRRTIREVDPPRPSQVLAALGPEERGAVAMQRGTDADKLAVLIRGDLDWIAMRCLEKDRTRRYETANGLANDVQRHLDNLPVAARPPSRGYILQKFVRRNRAPFAAAIAFAAVLIGGLAVSTWEAVRATRAERTAARERGDAEDLLTFMLGDLRDQLAKIGKLGVLESVAKMAMAHFASMDGADSSDAELARHAEALVQIGQIRREQLRFVEAAAAFNEAYGRAAALAARHPSDGGMLFARGQAEFWIGQVHWDRGELPAASDWFIRYNETSRALVALDPVRAEWNLELAHAQINLASVLTLRGDLDGARGGFMSALGTLDNILVRKPGDPDLVADVADTHSWLGTVAVQEGDFAEALRQFSAEEDLLEQLESAEPDNAQWRNVLANDAFLHLADVEMAEGKMPSAEGHLRQARRLIDGLVAGDPSNPTWLATSCKCRLLGAFFERWHGDLYAANRDAEEVCSRLEQLLAAVKADRALSHYLAAAWRLRAELLAVTDRATGGAAALKAVGLGERLIHSERATKADVSECAEACDLAGEICAAGGDSAGAQGYWKKAADLLAPYLKDSRDWHILDPAVRAAMRLGRTDEAQRGIRLLGQLGYVPLDPWPGIGDEPATANLTPKS
jgi:serine/threonine protein kinase/tetratricopeptide (TPR) repeat protein